MALSPQKDQNTKNKRAQDSSHTRDDQSQKLLVLDQNQLSTQEIQDHQQFQENQSITLKYKSQSDFKSKKFRSQSHLSQVSQGSQTEDNDFQIIKINQDSKPKLDQERESAFFGVQGEQISNTFHLNSTSFQQQENHISPSETFQQEQYEYEQKDPELKLLNHIMEAIGRKHDFLGNKKSLPYKKFKGLYAQQIEQNQKFQSIFGTNRSVNRSDVGVNNLMKAREAYLHQLENKLCLDIDGQQAKDKKPKKTKINFNKINHLEIVGNQLDQQYQSQREASLKQFDYNRLKGVLESKSISKAQLTKDKIEKLEFIHKSLLDRDFMSRGQTMVMVNDYQSSNAPMIEDHTFELSSIGNVRNSQVSTTRPHVKYDRDINLGQKKTSSVGIQNDIQKGEESIMLPILRNDKTLYTIENLNDLSIQSQRQVQRRQRRASIATEKCNMTTQTQNTQTVFQFHSLARNQPNKSNKIKVKEHISKQQRQRAERKEEERFQQEIKLLAQFL